MAGSDDGLVLGIHSAVNPGTEGSFNELVDGHAWISVTRNGRTQVYGLWPDEHPAVPDNGEATDIRAGLEAGHPATASRYYRLTPEQAATLEARLRDDVEWGYGNTCASWASDTVHAVTGERVQGAELLGLTDTPRRLIESIRELERQRATTQADPLRADELPARSSSFGAVDHGNLDGPDLSLHARAQAAVQAAGLGDPDGNLAASLALLARRSDMRIDAVVAGTTGNVFIVQDDGIPEANRRAHMPLDAARQRPAAEALAELRVATQGLAADRREPAQAQEQLAPRLAV